ncbi:MAG TPA: TM0106 family RecB-like putative nuclease [Candidatus Acidoferrum sp.]|nr:TM0106 family RecB-like putative nuclease [Candidatus Acidoferrum sp.]
MKQAGARIRLAATDLGNHLACRHLTTLDLQVAQGKRAEPEWSRGDLAVIRELGERFEKEYLAHLVAQGLTVENLSHIPHNEEERLLAKTMALMECGVQAIAQGALSGTDWFGRPDVLRRVETPCKRWAWSYEVADTKLAKETRATTILQLSLYSDLLANIQGTAPESLWVVTPNKGFSEEKYRVSDYAAYCRYVRERLWKAVGEETSNSTYPEPVEHCNVCKWFRECDAIRHADDHLSLVADIRRQQRDQFEDWNAGTMAKLAALPIPLKERPNHGSKEAYERTCKQARVQVEGRKKQRLVHEQILPPVEGMGFCRLPEPSAGDLFMDFEGDPFVEGLGLEYLFGFAFRNADGELVYEKRWALNRDEEKKGFEWLVDEIMRKREADNKMHVYHFRPYEPPALKRLMGMYATREDEIDRMLRAGVLVDLHQAFKQGVRASVEEYSLKKIEAFYGFERKIPPDVSRAAMRYVERRLELGWGEEVLPERERNVMEGYNAEDCFSTAMLRDWLEGERTKLVDSGTDVPRFSDRDEKASENVEEQQTRVAELVEQLANDIPKNPKERTKEQQARWLLAQLLDWHRRDAKPGAWRYFDLRGMDDADLLEERDAVSGLVWMGTVTSTGGVTADRYSFPNQETKIRPNDKKEVHYKDRRIGKVVAMDPIVRTIDIEKSGEAEGFHPTSIFLKEPYRSPREQQGSLYRLGCWVRDHGIAAAGHWQAARSFLLRKPPELLDSESLSVRDTEEFSDELTRIVTALSSSILAVQGPPGSGKTTSAARTIDALVTKRKMKIGVTALSHAVIRNLLKTIGIEGSGRVRCMHKSDKKYDGTSEKIEVTTTNRPALTGLMQGSVDVLGGTTFLWSREEFANSVDVLFVDEASQVSLADVMAISQAAKSLVLIGDPQQLARPGEASHPRGAELSGLEHILMDSELGQLKTMPLSLGLFIPETKRLHPSICNFTSETFYEGRLHTRTFTQSQILEGHRWLIGAGLWFIPVEHEGNRNSCAEEVEVVARVVEGLLKPEVKWARSAGNVRLLKEDDILIVAPYNAQVADLSARLPRMQKQIGTVDKFQGQQGAVVIYSMTTSSPEEAPHGMEFLYGLNRLNVATSRAMSAVIVVGSPRLFEPECRTPRQMELANALCRYRELATTVDEAHL